MNKDYAVFWGGYFRDTPGYVPDGLNVYPGLPGLAQQEDALADLQQYALNMKAFDHMGPLTSMLSEQVGK